MDGHFIPNAEKLVRLGCYSVHFYFMAFTRLSSLPSCFVKPGGGEPAVEANGFEGCFHDEDKIGNFYFQFNVNLN